MILKYFSQPNLLEPNDINEKSVKISVSFRV